MFRCFSIVSEHFLRKKNISCCLFVTARRATSSFDIILFGLVSKRDTPINLDLLNEFFRLLRPNGHLITHIERVKQSQIVDHFKMCGFTSCNPLDANSSFLIQNKDDAVKKQGSLWLCQKPSFDIGYSVPLRNAGQGASTTNGGVKKTWTVDDDDLIDTDVLLDENDRKKPDVKSNNRSRQTKRSVFLPSSSFRIRLWYRINGCSKGL